MTRFFCSDPAEVRLRDAWHAAKSAMEADPVPDNVREFHEAHRLLSTYLWDRVQAEQAEDRRRHPKAKRNLPKPENVEHLKPGQRAIP